MAHRFLVSTTQALLAINLERQQLRRVHSGSGLYYGLAKDANGLLYAACRNTVNGPDETVRADEAGSLLVLDNGFQVIRELQPPFPLRDVHGILCFQGRLWITCSFDNLIAIYDLATDEWSRWFPAPNPADRDHDVHHFNTVHELNGEICLTAHRFGPSELLFYDSSTLQLNSAVSIGAESHNVFLFEGAIATCSSLDGWLVSTAGKRLRTGNFPRGIAITSDGNLLGLSMVSDRAQRASQDGILRWYSPEWRFRADYLLPRVGMVLDILEIAEQELDWDALDDWPGLEIADGEYNQAAPKNRYASKSFAACAGKHALEWHATELTHCWTAAKRATLSILINPGETRILVEVGNAFPNSYRASIWLDETLLGVALFSTPGIQQYEFRIPIGFEGPAQLSFTVPHLWRPADVISGSTDKRLLGLAVYGVIVDL